MEQAFGILLVVPQSGRPRSREQDRRWPMCVRPGSVALSSCGVSQFWLTACWMWGIRVGPSPGSSPRWRSKSVPWV